MRSLISRDCKSEFLIEISSSKSSSIQHDIHLVKSGLCFRAGLLGSTVCCHNQSCIWHIYFTFPHSMVTSVHQLWKQQRGDERNQRWRTQGFKTSVHIPMGDVKMTAYKQCTSPSLRRPHCCVSWRSSVCRVVCECMNTLMHACTRAHLWFPYR